MRFPRVPAFAARRSAEVMAERRWWQGNMSGAWSPDKMLTWKRALGITFRGGVLRRL